MNRRTFIILTILIYTICGVLVCIYGKPKSFKSEYKTAYIYFQHAQHQKVKATLMSAKDSISCIKEALNLNYNYQITHMKVNEDGYYQIPPTGYSVWYIKYDPLKVKPINIVDTINTQGIHSYKGYGLYKITTFLQRVNFR